jgi:cohesin loading factor subunit SCC2
MAENVSAFDYKTQEEVLTVIRHLTSVLSVVGMALVETMAPTTLREPTHETPMTTSNQVALESL